METNNDIVKLNVNTSNKEFMFNLGRIFAAGKQIEILNKDDVNEEIVREEKLGYAKSFNMMIKFWQDNNLKTDLSSIAPNADNLFLICPVRNANEKEKSVLKSLIEKYENAGFNVHYPERDTNQNPVENGVNTGGYNICLENATAIANAKNVSVFYNKQSTGSMFDVGVVSYLQEFDKNRNFTIENDFVFDPSNFIDNKIMDLSHANDFDVEFDIEKDGM